MKCPVKIENLFFRYDREGKNILNNISLEAERGEVIAVMGPSGSGKSTLCYCIMGIIPHIYGGELSGEVHIFDEPVSRMNVPEIATKSGIIFQDPDTQLFSPTVEDDIAFGPENLCLERSETGRRIDESLGLVGMDKHRYSDPNRLSGGEKQLIAIASVLSLHPEVIIFDEAMSQLDEESRYRVKSIIKELKNEGKTVIIIEHETGNLDIADHLFILEDGALLGKDINKFRD
ncbi:MAG TPA: ABC transporter ATP-binding protein [Actinobacteria bacterium]|nr:ABC transporter ATP-binding protein [Actinomycetota bacterium]